MVSDYDFYLAMRAAYIQQASALKKSIEADVQQRAAILDMVSQIERKLGMKKDVNVTEAPPNATFTHTIQA